MRGVTKDRDTEFAIQIADRSANIAGLLGRFRLTVLAVPGKPLQAGLPESGLARLADRRAAALVLVVGGDVADAGVQPHAVVALADQRELGAQHRRVTDGEQVGPLGLDVAGQRLDPGQAWSVGVPGRPKCWWTAHNAMSSRVDPLVICGPLPLTASRTGRLGSSTVGSARPSWRALTRSSSPSCSSASVNTTWTWVAVSSAETISASHVRDTRSSVTVAATPARVKWVVS